MNKSLFSGIEALLDGMVEEKAIQERENLAKVIPAIQAAKEQYPVRLIRASDLFDMQEEPGVKFFILELTPEELAQAQQNGGKIAVGVNPICDCEVCTQRRSKAGGEGALLTDDGTVIN